jgi:hypothetical protein
VDDLVAFVRQQLDARDRQLDEDERVARHAAELAKTQDWWASAEGKVHDANSDGYRNLLGGENAWSLDDIGDHIARWDPARVLDEVKIGRAEVEAKRRILNEVEYVIRDAERRETGDGLGLSQTVLGFLAQPYAGRPGWREEWRA